MDLIFSRETSGKKDDEKEKLYRHLGHLACLLHSPVMKVPPTQCWAVQQHDLYHKVKGVHMTICVQNLSGLMIMGHKYNKEIIQRFKGDIEAWAACKLQVLSLQM